MIKNIPIAVVGVNTIYPKSHNSEEFWKNILDGTDLFQKVPESHWSIEDYYDSDPSNQLGVYANRGGFLPYVDFDPVEFGIPPKDISSIDIANLNEFYSNSMQLL